ncbi:ABC transporter permease [Microlunatus soli]|uniref:Putative ABC transport system permease protein n=1 Tax=Microlunatus soli TaxID=630515 RepID=A0A1H1NNX7_9ACTN|nr:ABC transporter permease [Microlunatus soli]SDS00716.1 putative ABC transport system permease protein [Microlunatus soli]
MITFALRELAANRSRIAMAVIAIMLGVTAAVAGWVASDSVASTLADQPVRDRVDLVVQSGRTPLTATERARIAAVPGVRSADPITVGRAGLVGPDGKLVPSQTAPEQAGTVFTAGAAGQRFAIVDGRRPQHVGEIAVGPDAIRAGVRVGSSVRVLLDGGKTTTQRVTGSYRYAALGPDDGATADPPPVVAFAPTEPTLLTRDLSRIEIGIEPGTDPAAVTAAIHRIVPGGSRVMSAATLASTMADEAADAANDLRMTLLPFAAVAVLVGAFVIANTFTLLISQRTRQFALLRAIGAKRRQVRWSVIVEASALGLVGATIGGVAGVTIAPALLRIVRSDEPVQLHVSPVAVAVAYGTGIVVTVLAALGAARRAARVSPMAALRLDVAEPSSSHRRSTVLGIALVAIATAGVLATARPDSANLPRIAALVSILVGSVGMLVLAPQLVRLTFGPLSRLLAPDRDRSSGRRIGPATRLAVRTAARDPRRTARTGTAITIGLALICAFGTFSSTFAQLIASTVLANTPAATTVLQPAAGGAATLAESDLRAVRNTPGVSTAAAARDIITGIDSPSGSTRLVITAIEPEALGTVLTPNMIAGSDDLHRGAVVSKNQADMLGLRIGSPITLHPDGRSIRTTVTGLYEATELSASLFYDVDLAPSSIKPALNTIYATGPDPAAVRTELQQRFAERPDVMITDREGLAQQGIQRQQIAFTLIYAMFALSVIIAVFGVVNTLVLSVGMRTRELGVLRAIGGSRTMIMAMIRMESLVIAIFGALLGLVIGILGGAVMQHAMLGQRIADFALPTGVIAGCLVGIVVAAVLASIWPAAKAARVEVLTAVSSS